MSELNAPRWRPLRALFLAWIVLVPAAAFALWGVYLTVSGLIGMAQGVEISEFYVVQGLPALAGGLLPGVPMAVFVARGGEAAFRWPSRPLRV